MVGTFSQSAPTVELLPPFTRPTSNRTQQVCQPAPPSALMAAPPPPNTSAHGDRVVAAAHGHGPAAPTRLAGPVRFRAPELCNAVLRCEPGQECVYTAFIYFNSLPDAISLSWAVDLNSVASSCICGRSILQGFSVFFPRHTAACHAITLTANNSAILQHFSTAGRMGVSGRVRISLDPPPPWR